MNEQQNNQQNTQPTGKQAYEAKKAEKQVAKNLGNTENIKTKKNSIKIVKITVALVLAGLVYWIVVLIINSAPQTQDQSVEIVGQGNEHINIGDNHIEYNSNPPTSGPHYGQPARGGFREEAIADEHLIHSLEHGLVWVSYRPGLSDEAINVLRGFAKDSMVVVTERQANDTDIAVAAWSRLDKFDLAGVTFSEDQIQRVKDFIIRYRNRGPEKIPAGQHGGV